MRILIEASISLAILFICLPAKGEVLIYKKKTENFSATGEEQPWTQIDDVINRGFFVFEVTYSPEGSINLIKKAMEISYRTTNGRQWYWHKVHQFDIAPVTLNNRLLWILIEKDYEFGAEILILKGWATNTRIDSNTREKKRIPRQLEGSFLSDLRIDERDIQISEISMRILTDMTRFANDEDAGNQDFDFAVEVIDASLKEKGYSPF